ncbi:hypothetical protein TNCV_2325191 [Trichonephila clavipes]|nr:hypothetical protein TNCV_2325191 [Trichonephila clavipes]
MAPGIEPRTLRPRVRDHNHPGYRGYNVTREGQPFTYQRMSGKKKSCLQETLDLLQNLLSEINDVLTDDFSDEVPANYLLEFSINYFSLMLKHLRFDIFELQETRLPLRLINTTNERRLVQGQEAQETTPQRVKGDIEDVSSELGDGD